MATPVVAWGELEAPFAQRNELPGVNRFQAHYACYHNKGFASSETDFLQARFNSQQGDTWLTVRLRIYVAPAETVLPIKKDRQFSPEFQIQVEVQSTRPITFEGTVYAFALNEQQKNELTVGLGEGSRLPRSVSDSLLAAATGQPNPGNHPFKGTSSVPVSIAFEPEVINCLPKEHIAKKVADATFSKLEFKNPSNMEPRYFLFAIAVGTSPAAADVSCVLFTPPTISICRGVQQRNKATKKLGYLNPDEMYAAVASRGGEAYKTKAGAFAKRASAADAEAAASPHGGSDSAMQDGENEGGQDQNQSGALSMEDLPANNPKTGNSLLHEKFWGDQSGGNMALQNPSIAAATASIFGNVPFSGASTAARSSPPSGRPAAKDIAKLFPRATSLATSGFEAVPLPKPTSMGMSRSAGIPSHPLPLPSTSNTTREKVGAAPTGTPFDGAFGAPDLLSSLQPFDPNSLSERGQHSGRDDGDALFSSLFMIPDDQNNNNTTNSSRKRQPSPAPDGAAAKGFSAFHTLVNSGNTDQGNSNSNPQQKLAQAPPLFTGLPGAPGSSHATLKARGGQGGANAAAAASAGMNAPVTTGDRGLSRTYSSTLQGIAQQVAAVGLGGSSGAAGASRNTANAQLSQGGQQSGAPRQQPVESPFGGPPGAGMGWQLGSGTLGESFDPLMALELLDSRAADALNPGMFSESQPTNMDMLFNSFAPSLEMAQAAAATSQPPSSTAAAIRTAAQGLERSRPTAPDAAAGGISCSQRQSRDAVADVAAALFGAGRGAAAACERDRERSFQTEGFQAHDLQCSDAHRGGDHHAAADVPPPPGISFSTPEEDDADEHPSSTSFPNLEMSFDFGCLEAPQTTSSLPANSREEGTAGRSSNGAPSVNLAIDAEMEVPDAADRGLVGQDTSALGAFTAAGTTAGPGALEEIYADVPHEHDQAVAGSENIQLCAVGPVALANHS